MTVQTKLEMAPRRVIVIGAGRLGNAIAPALRAGGVDVVGPLRKGDGLPAIGANDVILLCVPDAAIAEVARSITAGPLVGHCSGALTLDVLGAHRRFSMHPLLSVTADGAKFRGAACAVAGSAEDALHVARLLAGALGMDVVEIPDSQRALYHAAASMASNYLVTIEDAADQLARHTGIQRAHLARLAQSALDNWAKLGGSSALTGPIVRGDDATVSRQRAAVADATPHLVQLWDALADATRALARDSSRTEPS